MKTIGIIGGMSWESTTDYYRIINTVVKEELGGLHSAKILLYSVDFQEIEKYQFSGEWMKNAEILSSAALKLENAGADFIIIATNTMHKVVPEISKIISIPILHIAQVTANILLEKKIKKIGLLGTKFTMEEAFYKDVLIDNNIEVITPDEEDRKTVSDIIYDELCLGNILEQSKEKYVEIINKMQDLQVEGIILGCTEIGMLISQKDVTIPLFDTTQLHARQAAFLAIEK